ncbi:MAG: hypothetical protein KME13_16175 [Myxacorys californica WJT36-NPBG1]|jgi:hypothetical protein|nr:hypothetical protein [Myxacorys californica WJT36-NPBG1]
MTHNTSRIIFELEEIDIAVRNVIHAYHHENECTEERLEKVLDRINTIAILYGNIVKVLDGIEQRSLQELKLRKLLIPSDFEGAWYVACSHSRIANTESDPQIAPTH